MNEFSLLDPIPGLVLCEGHPAEEDSLGHFDLSLASLAQGQEEDPPAKKRGRTPDSHDECSSKRQKVQVDLDKLGKDVQNNAGDVRTLQMVMTELIKRCQALEERVDEGAEREAKLTSENTEIRALLHKCVPKWQDLRTSVAELYSLNARQTQDTLNLSRGAAAIKLGMKHVFDTLQDLSEKSAECQKSRQQEHDHKA